MLQMIVSPAATPEPIKWNYDELKAELTTSLAKFENRIYTENDMPEAKKERATLNQLKKVLNDERIRREKEYMAPFVEFKSQVAELCSIIDVASQKIGAQIDAFEEKRIEEKRGYIENVFYSCVTAMLHVNTIPDWLPLDRILDEKWLNKTFTIGKVKDAIVERLNGIVEDLETIKNMEEPDSTDTFIYYTKSLNLNEAIRQCREMKTARVKVEPARVAAPVPAPTNEESKWIAFRALLTVKQASALAKFCRENGIKLEQIKEV